MQVLLQTKLYQPAFCHKVVARLHLHLFADLLQLQLKRSTPELTSGLRSKASQWYAAHDILNQAIMHAIWAP